MSNLLMDNNPLSAILAFFVMLIPLILIHELGHFLAAKAVGISILEFAIGFPPRITKLFTWGETDFTLNWIPLGGYVRPLGEDMIRPLVEEAVEKDREELRIRHQSAPSLMDGDEKNSTVSLKAVNDAKPLARIFFMAAGAFANFILAFLLFAVIALTGIPQLAGGSVFIVAVDPSSPMAEAGLQANDFILEINGQNFADSQEFWQKILEAKGNDVRLTIQHGNNPEKIDTIVPTASISGTSNIQNYTQITGVVSGAPGDQAGLKPGDVVIAFNGQSINGISGFQQQTQKHTGEQISLTVLRDGKTFDVDLMPRANPPEGQGAIGIVITPYYQDLTTGLTYQEGFAQETLVSLPLGQAGEYGLNRIASVISLTVQLPAQLVSGALTPEEARPVSIVGMSQIGGEMIQQSIQQGRAAPILDFIAVISVALGFFNLLPIPALDGGRILFVLIEIVRGRPISPEREGLVHLVGLALLLSLSVLVILNDVINPITNVLR